MIWRIERRELLRKREESLAEFKNLCYKRLKMFSGEIDVNAIEFFNQFEHLAKCFEVNDETKLKVLRQMLTGNALSAFNIRNESNHGSAPTSNNFNRFGMLCVSFFSH